MTRAATPEETAEVTNLIAEIFPNKTLISRDCILDLIEATPDKYPAIMANQGRLRFEIVTRVMNQRYVLWNQTAQKPRGRVWVLNNQKQGVACVSC